MPWKGGRGGFLRLARWLDGHFTSLYLAATRRPYETAAGAAVVLFLLGALAVRCSRPSRRAAAKKTE